MNLCECGCGQQTKLASKTDSKRGWRKGEPLRFINGHNASLIERETTQVEKQCTYCSKLYKVILCRDKKTLYCSLNCKTAHFNKLNARKAGELTTHHGRLKIKIPDHPYCDKGGYVFLHRHVVENHLGYYLDPKEYDVHHIDEDISNNSLTNLVAITHSAHMRLHALKRRMWELSPR